MGTVGAKPGPAEPKRFAPHGAIIMGWMVGYKALTTNVVLKCFNKRIANAAAGSILVGQAKWLGDRGRVVFHFPRPR